MSHLSPRRLVRFHRFLRAVVGTAIVLVLAVRPAYAQMGAGDGFLFRVPTLRLGISGGFAQPRGQGDIYDLLTSELTLDRSDFASAAVGLSAAVRVAPRLDIGLSASYTGREAASESRDFQGEDDLPIVQTTSLDRAAIMATGRFSLVSPGRAIGRYAWIPRRIVPFVGGGAGAVWYRLHQQGEFVDRETLDIFEDEFESKGWSVGATGFGGADISLTPRLGLSLEGRYLWGKAPMNGDFGTFNKIDLSGYDTSIGLFVRF